MARRRSRHGLHLAVEATHFELNGRALETPCLLPCLCRTSLLCSRLARELRIKDRVRLAGLVEPYRRKPNPILTRDWDLIITSADIPARLRRWTLTEGLHRPRGGLF